MKTFFGQISFFTLKIEHELYIVSYKHDAQFVSPWCPQHLAQEVSWLCLSSQRMGRQKGKYVGGSGAHACTFCLPPTKTSLSVRSLLTSLFTVNLVRNIRISHQ